MSGAQRSIDAACYAVLVGTSAVATWLLAGGILSYDLATTAVTTLSILVLVQWFVALVCAPVFAEFDGWRNITFVAMGIVVIPWPIFAFCLQMADVEPYLVLVQQALIVIGLLISFRCAVWFKRILPEWLQPQVVVALQTLPLIALLSSYGLWSG